MLKPHTLISRSFDYPGSGHLFTDPGLAEEYDPESTRILWDRVGPFVARHP
jgi:hypothetical protein